MTDTTKIFHLIVRQGPANSPQLNPLLQLLKEKFGLDPYTARVRLTGSGKSMFGKGPLQKTTELANALRQHGYSCWIISKSEMKFSPMRLREIEVLEDEVHLVGRDAKVTLSRGCKVVAVLADISGKLEEQTLKRHAIQSRYKKASHVTGMEEAKLLEAVLKGSPVLDLYLLDEKGQPQGAVRAFPGRFNANGLGERMTMSATRNLLAISDLAREYAGQFSLHADFSLGRLPQCQIKNLDGQSLDDRQILKSLTRFGWLMCDLEQDQSEKTEKDKKPDPTLVAIAAAAGRPELAAAVASGNMDAVPGLNEVVNEIKAATAEEPDIKGAAEEDEWLPAPPERPPRQLSGRMMLTTLGSFVLAGVFAVISAGDSSLLRWLMKNSMKAGIFPALLSVGFFWGGYYSLRLKRLIENTPTSKVRSIAMGLVEVHGKTVRKYALVSPMNQSPCVYYRLRKYKKDNRNRWVLKSDKDSRHVPFMVDDGTGQVLVDPHRATVRAKTSRKGLPGEATLAFHGVSSDDRDEKWVEDIIFEGSSLYVLGYAQPIKTQRKSLRERTIEKLRELKLDRKALHRYDTDGDGQISEDEWQVARSDAEQMALRDHLATSSSGKRQYEHAVITWPPQRGLPMVLAETAEEAHLVKKYWLISIPLIIFGMISAGFALYGLLQFIGV